MCVLLDGREGLYVTGECRGVKMCPITETKFMKRDVSFEDRDWWRNSEDSCRLKRESTRCRGKKWVNRKGELRVV